MFGWCCEEQSVRNEQLFVYRGNGNARSVISVSQVNLAILKEDSHFQIFENSHYDDQLNKCRQENKEFVDWKFQVDKQITSRRNGRKITWKRLKDFPRNSEDSLLEERPIRDIISLNENDSYFLATLAAIGRHPSNIRDILCGDNYNPQGIYRLNVCVHGKPKQIVIDDYLPVYEDNQIRTAFSKAERGLHWVLLLEKAYAKIRGGYENIASGYAHQVLTTFTLAPCIYSLVPLNFNQQSQEKLWVKLVEAKHYRFPMVCGSRKRYTCDGIAMNQTYPFEDCRVEITKDHKHRMIRLVNIPGYYSQAQNCSIHFISNGEYLQLELVQFMRNFEVIDVAHVRSQFNSHFYAYNSAPLQYQFYIFDVKQHLSFYLTLQRERQESGRLRIILAKVLDNQPTDYELISCKIQEIFSDVTLQCCDLAAGRYVVCCQSQLKSQCFLRVYSESAIPFQESKLDSLRFLQHICYNNALKNRDKFFVMSKNSQDWYYTKVMFQEIGLGFVIINIEESSNAKCLIIYRKEDLQAEGFDVVNKKDKFFYSTIKGSEIQILIFQPLKTSRQQYLQFPPKSVQIRLIL